MAQEEMTRDEMVVRTITAISVMQPLIEMRDRSYFDIRDFLAGLSRQTLDNALIGMGELKRLIQGECDRRDRKGVDNGR